MNQFRTSTRTQPRPKVPFLYAASFLLLLTLICLSLYNATKAPAPQQVAHTITEAKPAPANPNPPYSAPHFSPAFPATSPTATRPVNTFFPKVLTTPEFSSPAAQKLTEFFQTRKVQALRDIKRADLEAFVEAVTDRYAPEEIAGWLQDALKIPPQYVLQTSNVKSSLLGLYDAVVGSSDTSSQPEKRLTFTDQCETTGRITGNTGTIPSGTKRVYAVFENDGNLANLQHVLAIWRDSSDDSISFTECELLRPDTRYNYVWLQPKKGWPSGTYQLDLCNPADNSQTLVTQTFTVQ